MPFGQFTLCRACEDFLVCVAVMHLTLRTGCERHGRKNPLPFPYFAAVTCRQSAPDFLIRERQEFKEEGKPQVSLPFCPRRGRGSLPRSAERSSFAEVQRKTLRPVRANPLTQFEHPGFPVQKKAAVCQGRTACAVRAPRSSGAEKGCRPEWANRLRGSCTP